VKARVVAVGGALVALAVTAGVLANADAPPDPLQQATADGCERNDSTLHTLQSPNWVYVNDKDYPASGAPPALQSVGGILQRDALNVHTSGGDNPVSHAAYDVNFNVSVAAANADLVARTNTSGGLHVEREEGSTPEFVWPEPGDRVTMRGYWVWDCDHFTTNGEVTGEETELHPWTALWVRRAHSARSRAGESEADLYLTTDKTEAGKSSDCAHRTKHDQAAFKVCVHADPNRVDMSGAYDFLLPAKGTVRVVDAGSVNAPPIRMRGQHLTFVVPKDGRRHVLAKEVFVRPIQATAHVRVTFDKVLVRRAMDPGCIPAAPPGCGTPETTRDDQVSRGPAGEWNFYSDVAGVWSLWTPHVWHASDGQTLRPRKSVDVWLPSARSWRVLVWARECDWGTLALSGSGALFPCPRQTEVGNRGGEDVPGAATVTFRSIASSLGTHDVNSSNGGSTCPAVNKSGCYRVTFTVRRMAR
jgi:hypothetical protein